MAGVTLSQVRKSYGATRVIDGLSLTVEAGEFLVLLGPSGCGKSTLLRMIAGLESVDDGEIHIGDRRVDLLPPGARGVAMVFSITPLPAHERPREYGLRPAQCGDGRGRDRTPGECGATTLEIEELLDRKPPAFGRPAPASPLPARSPRSRSCSCRRALSNLDAALRIRTGWSSPSFTSGFAPRPSSSPTTRSRR